MLISMFCNLKRFEYKYRLVMELVVNGPAAVEVNGKQV